MDKFNKYAYNKSKLVNKRDNSFRLEKHIINMSFAAAKKYKEEIVKQCITWVNLVIFRSL